MPLKDHFHEPLSSQRHWHGFHNGFRPRTVRALAGTAHRVSKYNRRLFHHLHQEALTGEGVRISMTDCYRHSDYGEPIVALKSYMLSPHIEERHVELLVERVLAARDAIKL